jgi:non-heme chloroperoxidase
MVDMHLEVNVIPVSDIEQSKKFYQRLGWRLDDDVAPADEVRLVQLTPPGSACSVTFGKGITPAAPDSAVGGLTKDRYAWFKFFFDNFYNVDKLHGTRISDEAWNASFQVAVGSSAYATMACVSTWLTDFRADLPKIDVPMLVVQGSEDRILPIDATGRRLPGLVKDVRFIEIDGGPHNVGWTHPDEVNKAFLDFLAE